MKHFNCLFICMMLSFFVFGSLAVNGQEDALAKAKKNYEAAKKKFEADATEENTIWYGRRTAYLGKYKEAIVIYTKGLEKFPGSYKLYRHRGHRYISTRQFSKAIEDFKKAAELVKGKPRETEPDGMPNAQNIPLSNTQFNIYYHLGLAHYLKGDFKSAEKAYGECMIWSNNDDLLTATIHWYYMTLRRMNKPELAKHLLDEIRDDMKIIENDDYYRLLLVYNGTKTPEQTAPGSKIGRLASSLGYGIGNWYYYNNQKEKAKAVFEKIVKQKQTSAFGYIAAETDLKRLGL